MPPLTSPIDLMMRNKQVMIDRTNVKIAPSVVSAAGEISCDPGAGNAYTELKPHVQFRILNLENIRSSWMELVTLLNMRAM